MWETSSAMFRDSDAGFIRAIMLLMPELFMLPGDIVYQEGDADAAM